MQFQLDELIQNDFQQLYFSEYFGNYEQTPAKEMEKEDNMSNTSSDKSDSDKEKSFGEILLQEGHEFEQNFLNNNKESLQKFNEKAHRIQKALDRFSNKIINFFNKDEPKNLSQ
ncbi:hypothetical protein TTHERM_00256940 (macronuclear) [Tetrahymena thermophila SB210]|uniref:Uncharacterized protein n=1 Tax=Tetrahymena thermophila (strain SB210) TaxID=312017 RepID=Q23QI4_TETTS|nr:hypothetical protein TTHERM_00256940 [Tetrahymena thermophila SB210]EAR98904.3 hypothetical protein TTHERM_00256940 [Tetrahymena thermophila SB210]|eukprot:XP_001019149.3 hypothetical protein TTHERM_00256940 [Tetrahymena thermophila SB210]